MVRNTLLPCCWLAGWQVGRIVGFDYCTEGQDAEGQDPEGQDPEGLYYVFYCILIELYCIVLSEVGSSPQLGNALQKA